MKKIFPVIIFFFHFSTKVFSQTDAALKYSESITQAGLKEQLSIIASAEMKEEKPVLKVKEKQQLILKASSRKRVLHLYRL